MRKGRWQLPLMIAVAAAVSISAPVAWGLPGQAESVAPRFPAAWRHALFVQPLLLSRYNRVDGVVQSLKLHGRVPLDYARPPLLEVYGRLDARTTELPHYHIRGGLLGIASNLPRARLGATHGYWARIAVEYQKQTASPDDWIIGGTENTLAALLTKYDYKNYYLSEGYRVVLSARAIARSQTLGFGFHFAWHNHLHWPLGASAEWSLVPLRRAFRPNIAATNGRERGLRLGASVTIQDSPRVPRHTLVVTTELEKVGGSLGGDFEHDGAFLHARLRSATVGMQSLCLRLAAGARTGWLAPQHLLRLGGIGTLRGVPHQDLTGNRMWMINAEYRLGSILPRVPSFFPFRCDYVRRFVSLTEFGVLYDVGRAYRSGCRSEVLADWFEGGGTDNWGLFLSLADDLLRIEWATTRLIGHEYPDVLRLRVAMKR